MPRNNKNKGLHGAALGHGKILGRWMNHIIGTCCKARGLILENKEKSCYFLKFIAFFFGGFVLPCFM